jgi:hypothetical protein
MISQRLTLFCVGDGCMYIDFAPIILLVAHEDIKFPLRPADPLYLTAGAANARLIGLAAFNLLHSHQF